MWSRIFLFDKIRKITLTKGTFMGKHLLITGAGVDRSEGINFPLANTLLADVAGYLADKDNCVDSELRKMIPGLRFNFNNMIARAVDKVATREIHEQKQMIQRVREVLTNLEENDDKNKKLAQLLIKLFEKLATIAEQSYLDEETESLIRDVFPDDADDIIDSDSILDIHKLSLSDTFKLVLKRTLRMSLKGDNPIARAIGADLLNIETLLIEKFLGFYNENPADIKNYIYISWSLWAYLVHKQQEVISKNSSLPFYSQLHKDIKAVTLNYTYFLENQLTGNNVIYFHGGLAEYVRMDTRDLLNIENILSLNPSDFIRDVIAPSINLHDYDISKQVHIIPSLVPPLRLKPVLSNKYIELWAKSTDWIKEAEHIVIIGYSFNNADEHFNDILRCYHNDKKIDIVVPHADGDYFKNRIEKVFNIPQNQLTKVTVQNRSALQCRNIRLISACATEIDVSELFGLVC